MRDQRHPTANAELTAPTRIGSGDWLGRVKWTQDEDDMLRYWYGCANGAMTPYRHMAEWLNEHFHGGKPIRKVGAVVRRDGKINYGK